MYSLWCIAAGVFILFLAQIRSKSESIGFPPPPKIVSFFFFYSLSLFEQTISILFRSFVVFCFQGFMTTKPFPFILDYVDDYVGVGGGM